MCGSDPGIDPYTRVVSDVYQDLFHEGSFIGKGIYDVDAFEQALNGRFPENRILSHDLIEGCYARAGLLSDVQLYEEYPSRYSADVSRRHRWIRGDWQIMRWLLPGVPGLNGPLSKESALAAVPMEDLRQPSAQSRAFGINTSVAAGLDGLAICMVLDLVGDRDNLIPSLITSILDLLQKPDDVLLGQHLAAAVRSTRRHFAQAVFTLVCLPYEAFFSLDAIVRTTVENAGHAQTASRMESVTATRIAITAPQGISLQSAGRCGSLPLLPLQQVIYLTLSNPAALAAAGPILCLWFASPVIAWWISRPLARREARLTDDQTIFLRKLSRKTWAFFETFVGPEDNWLPPDNYQEYPRCRGRASHVADQHGTCAAREFVRIRLRLHFSRTTHRAHGECIPHNGSPGTAPGPLLQLV